MEFIQNKGQWHSNVEFKSEFTTGAFFLEKKGFTVLLHNPQDLKSLFNVLHGHDGDLNAGQVKMPEANNTVKLRSFAYKVKFLGANGVFNALPEKPITTHNNYFLGNDKSKWAADCKLYQSVLYTNVYPNIDVRYYSNGGKLKYDFIVRPGGNPNAIAMRYDGPTLSINNKQLVIKTPVGEVTEMEPYAYIRGDAKPMPLSCKYVIKDNVVSFDVKEYDRTKTMVIDPSIIFATLPEAHQTIGGILLHPALMEVFLREAYPSAQAIRFHPAVLIKRLTEVLPPVTQLVLIWLFLSFLPMAATEFMQLISEVVEMSSRIA